MFVEKMTVALTTDASGDVVAYSGNVAYAKISDITITQGTLEDNFSLLIEGETSGKLILNKADVTESETIAPRQSTHATDGSSGEGEDDIVIANERIKVTVAGGGNAKTGSIEITLT